jgi:carbohydrate ABC transporter substrate-binding protein, CUT1 family (TC 3.A.1.1.-)
MKRRIVVAAGAAIGLLTLTACGGGGGDASGGADSRGDITIWYSNNEAEIAWGTQMVDAWNADHPDEQITAQEIPAGSSSEEVIGASITAGNAPCLIFNTSPAAVPQFQKQGGLVNLSEFEDGDDYITARTGDIADQYRSEDGSFYQMPWKSNPVMIFYNKDMFAEAGLDAENPSLATYDEFLDTATTLVDAGVSSYAINPAPTSEFFQPWFDFYPLYAAQTGGTLLVEDGAATFDDDDGAAVAEFWRTLYADQLAGNEQYQGDAFADGYAAMAIVGPWAIAVYGDSVNWGAVPVPTQTGTDPA